MCRCLRLARCGAGMTKCLTNPRPTHLVSRPRRFRRVARPSDLVSPRWRAAAQRRLLAEQSNRGGWHMRRTRAVGVVVALIAAFIGIAATPAQAKTIAVASGGSIQN